MDLYFPTFFFLITFLLYPAPSLAEKVEQTRDDIKLPFAFGAHGRRVCYSFDCVFSVLVVAVRTPLHTIVERVIRVFSFFFFFLVIFFSLFRGLAVSRAALIQPIMPCNDAQPDYEQREPVAIII